MPDLDSLLQIGTRLLAASVAGAVIGIQREWSGKAAGLRTHMLVALGTATLVIACVEHGMQDDPLSRVIQGLVTGIGFIGAGAILKIAGAREIKGLTTAAGIWMTTAAAIAIGFGEYATAFMAVALAWLILTALLRLENYLSGRSDTNQK